MTKKKFSVTGYKVYTTYEKIYFSKVEANSPEEALELIKKNPEDFDIDDTKCLDIENAEFTDQDDWEAKECK